MSPDLTSPPAPYAPAAAPFVRQRAMLHADPLSLTGPVVLGTDGRGSDAAYRAARRVADRLGVGIEVVAVLQPLPEYTIGTGLPPVPPGFEAERRAEIEEVVRRRLSDAIGAAGWRLHVRYGDPARSICELATERAASLVVVGIGRHSPLDRIFGSETALRVVRHADRPVLAVAADFAALPTSAVVATDFSPASVRAAQVALRLVPPGGSLTLLHVGPEPGDLRTPARAEWATAWEANLAALFGRLREVLHPDLPDDVELRTRQVHGPVADAVLAASLEERAQLIATGTYGPGFVERLVVGSVAATLLRRTAGSLLVVPPPPPAQRAELRLRMAGTVETNEPGDWSETLAAFSRRNLGRRAILEVDDPTLGAQLEQRGWAFLGAAYDPHDECVELMFGDPASATRHLTRSIARPYAIGIHAGDQGRDAALRVVHEEAGQTMVTFMDGA
ncbi:MAG: universal stress protein [Gemmatimonadaceae bacterium]